MLNPLNLKQVSDVSTKFSNVFVGKSKFLNIKVADANYFLTCHHPLGGFSAGVLIGLKIAGFDAVLALKSCPDLELFDKNFRT
jgi:hypothetical protein